MRKVVALALLVGGPLYLKRRRDERREHVEIHFDDGSTVELADDAPQAGRLLELARQAL